MRITGGRAKGITLVLPKGDVVRPATDAMRQAVFSSLAAVVPGAVFWDLFAGSGAYGLEALSRGAAGGVFVENNAKAAACVRANLAAVAKSLAREPDCARVVPADATRGAGPGGVVPDLVFVDPPYEIIPEIAPVMFALFDCALAGKPHAIVVFEMPGGMDLAPPGWELIKRLGKGARQPTACFYRRQRTAS
jgi:16S rRNA (guanine966-N2)-methyltransferase